jgi:hypothetical protein
MNNDNIVIGKIGHVQVKVRSWRGWDFIRHSTAKSWMNEVNKKALHYTSFEGIQFKKRGLNV